MKKPPVPYPKLNAAKPTQKSRPATQSTNMKTPKIALQSHFQGGQQICERVETFLLSSFG